jgi:hypothetical protein
MLLSGMVLAAAHAQQATIAQDAIHGANPLVGCWKPDIEKSTNPTAESELIAITPQDEQFQITFQTMQANKYNPHYQVITEMRGGTSKLVQADGNTQCSANRTYRFHARWLTDHAEPEVITRIFDSFRLLTNQSDQ